MLRLILPLITLLFSANVLAQSPTKILIANEGYNDFSTGEQVVKPSIAVYDIASDVYQVIEEIEGSSFTSDIEIDGNFFYVAADNKVLKYEINSLQRVATLEVEGVRKLAFYEDQMIITRGDFGVTFDHYVQSYDKNDFSLLYELDQVEGPAYSSEDIVVENGMAYVAVNNAFEFPNYKGLVGVVDLQNNAYVKEFNLGVNGNNPDYMTIENGVLYTLNNQDFSTSSVSQINLTNDEVSTNDLLTAGGCGSSIFAKGKFHYQVSGEDLIKSYDFDQNTTIGNLLEGRFIYGLHYEPASNIYYAGVTDFVTSGSLFSFNESGEILNEFNAGVSPGNITFVYGNSSDVNDISQGSIEISPNPFSEGFTIASDNMEDINQILVRDHLGRIIGEWNGVNLNANIYSSNWAPGMYILEYQMSNKTYSTKLIKQ